MPEYRGAWYFAQVAMRRRSRLSEVRAAHITDPDALTVLGGRTMLTTVYDLIPLREGISRRRILAWAGYRSYLRALQRVETLFAISAQTASDVVELLRIPTDRIVVVPPGIDLHPSLEGSIAGGSTPYFLFIGGPNPNKNLAVVLDALVMCPELAGELRVTGRWLPKQLAGLKQQLAAMGLSNRVRHLGFVPSGALPLLMRQATALVVPSRYEGFGLPVGEGLAAGAFVIHSRIPVLEEVSAGAALTFDPGSPEQLAACLKRAAGDPNVQRDLRTKGARRAQELTWDAGVERTIASYRAVLDRVDVH